MLSPQEEVQRVAELHQAVEKAPDEEAKASLLTHGYLPQRSEGLIEAGTRCLAFLDPTAGASETTKAAVTRLRAIVSRLKLQPPSERSRRAIEELEMRLASFQSADALEAKKDYGACLVMVVALVLLVAGLIGLVIWLVG